MRILLLSGSAKDADAVRHALRGSLPEAQVEVVSLEALDTLASLGAGADAVVMAVPVGQLERSVGIARQHLPLLPLVAVVPEGDQRAVALALLAGADDTLAHTPANLTRIDVTLARLQRRDRAAPRQSWQLWLAAAGDNTTLRQRLAQHLGTRLRITQLASTGSLTPPIDDGAPVTAVIVEAVEHADLSLIGVLRLREQRPDLAILVVAEASHHGAFLRAGAQECLPASTDVDRLLLSVERVAALKHGESELTTLRVREHRLRALVEYLPDAVMLVSPSRAVLAVNLAGLELLGTDEARHIIGRDVSEWLAAEDLSQTMAAVADGASLAFTAATRHAAGSRALQVRGVPFQREPGKPAAALLVLHESTRTIDQPEVSADAARAAVADARSEVAASRAEQMRLEQVAAQAQERAMALERECELLRAHASEAGAARASAAASSETEQRVTALERELSEARGVQAHALALETEVSALREAQQRTIELIRENAELRGQLDVARRAPAALETAIDAETRWLLYEVASIGHLTSTPDARILGANDIAARLLGHFSRDALQASGQLPPPLLLAAGPFMHRPTRFEVCLQHGDDGPLHWLVGLATPQAGHPPTVTWMLIDVSEQRMQMRRARFLRRMEALTHVLSAATVECATLVARAGRVLDVASSDLAGRDDLDVSGSIQALSRTESVLAQLAGFAGKRARRPEVRDVRNVIDGVAAVLVHVAGDDIACSFHPGGEPLYATIEAAEFEQLLTALMMVGRDALPLGGRLTLATEPVNTDAREDGTVFTRPSIELRLVAEGYGAVLPASASTLESPAARLGATFIAEADDRGVVRLTVRLPRVFLIQ